MGSTKLDILLCAPIFFCWTFLTTSSASWFLFTKITSGCTWITVQQAGVEVQVVASEPQVRQLAKVKDFGFVGYFGFEESVDK
jgi:hypothetical protein